jgi:hypothetical protein
MAGRTVRTAFVIAMLAAALGAPPSLATEPATSPPWFDVAIPGGRARLAQAAGLDPTTDLWRLLPDLTRRLHASYGERTAARMAPQLAAYSAGASLATAGEGTPPLADGDGSTPVLLVPAEPHLPAPARAPTAAGDRVTLPLSPAAWDRILGRDRDGRPRDILTAIVVDGAAARLYRGLSTFDAPTLAALADGHALRTIYRRHTDAFTAFAASFRVEGGRVQVPGGHDAAALWQDIVGASVMRPGDFLVQLAAADLGRVFFLYDTIDRLDDAHRRFALAAPEPDPARRRERVRALRASFALADPWWDAARLPFSRPVADAPRVLQTARVTADGVLAPPNRQLLWTAAFDDQVEGAPEWRARLARSAPADAAWLVERIATVESNQARSRLGMLAFAQRVFGHAEADAGELLAALRGFGRYRALALTLERIGLRDPALYAAAARHAERIEEAGRGDRGRATLAQFQGALVLLERAVAAGSLDAEAAGALVRSLSGVRIEDGRYDDRLAAWIDQELLPGLRTRLGLPAVARAEAVVVRALAGPRAPAATRLQWEGLAYDVDPAEAEYRRLRAIRARQGGSTLEEALADTGAQRESRLAIALTDLAYAAALGPAEGAPAASEDVARRHDFGFEEPQTLGGPHPEWMVPREVAGPGQRWHVQGALLGLDVALARLALRRLDTEVPPVPLLSAADRRAFAEGAVLVRAAALDDAARDRIAEALGRGRARLAEAAADPGALARVTADLRLRDWRRGALSSIAARDPAHFESAFTLAEQLWLGGGNEAETATSAWGTSARWDDGCLCPRLGRPAPLDELAGRTADGRLAALAPDLHLRLAELLAEMNLPARLLPALLSLAVQDLMDEAEPAYLDDALAIARYARGLTRARMEDYVAALVGRGPLVPASEP